ncbi:restriction endonuclease subunit S [Candidatus Accumulibacter vicinus]|uniref:restriction endonuclease subunit S n=1 Tax=Candidatus Accumulibacter vicinus TaxID=2954382 RepID=UPI00235B5D7E|nr:restriction endonuclease subunit S [Candidatus Accumulibacter vicinus]
MSGADPRRAGWETIPLRYVCELNPSVAFDGFDEDDDLTFLPMDRVKSGYFIPNTDKLSKYGSSYTAFEDGDIVLAKVTPCFENGNIAIADGLVSGKGFGSSELFVIRPTTAERRFLFYYFQSLTFKQAGEASMTGAGGLKRVSPDILRQHHLPLPSQDIQRLIASYLDRETARIDGLIAEKERMLALLEEKRAALINRVVTRGLDPTARLRPSSQEWLGEIPAHWEMSRLKYLGETVLGLTFNPDDLVNEGEGMLVLRASNVKNRKIVLEDNIFVQTDIPQKLRTKPFDILICSRSGSRALIGKNALITNETSDLTFGAFMTVYRSSLNRFLFWVFNSTLFEFQAGAFGTSTINQLTTETLANMEVPTPPLEERDAIAEFLEQTSIRFDNTMSAVSQSIDLAKERRAALISAAVTGQIPLER